MPTLADNFGYGRQVCARVMPGRGDVLLLRIVHFQHARVLRPRIARRAALGRLGHYLELCRAACALSQRRAHAVGARVAAADYDYILALSVYRGFAPAQQRARGFAQVVNREVYALKLPSGRF